MTSGTTTPASSKVATVLRVTSGNFLEMFDFFLFGFYASHIAKAFFPTENELSSLLFTFATFGAGFLMRPLGAIILGAYVDRVGRRQGLIVTLGDHGHGHDPDRVRAELRHDRPHRAGSGPHRPPAAGFLRRRRAGRRLGLSVRDGTTRAEGILRLLAVRQSASRHRGRGADRLHAQQIVDARSGQRLGLAHTVLHRLPDCSGDFHDPPLSCRKPRSSSIASIGRARRRSSARSSTTGRSCCSASCSSP